MHTFLNGITRTLKMKSRISVVFTANPECKDFRNYGKMSKTVLFNSELCD
jgi:hypothetical protein